MILSLDASLSSTGYAIVDKDDNLYDFGKITTKYSKNTEDERIYTIARKVEDLIYNNGIDTVVIESQYVYRNPKVAMQLSRLRGAITYVCMGEGVKIIYLTPAEIRKKFLSCATKTKEEIAEAVLYKYKDNEDTTKKLVALGDFNDGDNKKKNSDIFDAISIALAYIEGGAIDG